MGGGFDPAKALANLRALRAGGGIHPDWRGGAREDAAQILYETLCGIEFGQRDSSAVVKVDGTVLLSATANGKDFAEWHAVLFHLREQHIERLSPHQRRTVNNERVVMAQRALSGAVVRQRLVEIQRLVINNAPRIVVDHLRRKTLRAGIESEKKPGHACVCSRADLPRQLVT